MGKVSAVCVLLGLWVGFWIGTGLCRITSPCRCPDLPQWVAQMDTAAVTTTTITTPTKGVDG